MEDREPLSIAHRMIFNDRHREGFAIFKSCLRANPSSRASTGTMKISKGNAKRSCAWGFRDFEIATIAKPSSRRSEISFTLRVIIFSLLFHGYTVKHTSKKNMPCNPSFEWYTRGTYWTPPWWVWFNTTNQNAAEVLHWGKTHFTR